MSVLVVDDDHDVREVLRSQLSERRLRRHGGSRLARGGPRRAGALEARPATGRLCAAWRWGATRFVKRAQHQIGDLPASVFVTGYADGNGIESALGKDALVLHQPFPAPPSCTAVLGEGHPAPATRCGVVTLLSRWLGVVGQ